MKKNEDQLTIRQKKAARKTGFLRIIGVLAALMVLVALLMRFVFGIAYCRENLPSSGIPAHSGILYLKVLGRYGQADAVVYRDLSADRVFIKKGADYDRLLKENGAVHTRILGKVIWQIPMEGMGEK